jgi:hypothetical protein
MACHWNLDYGTPDPETRTVDCRCNECGRVKALYCDRDFETGELIVQVETCAEKRRPTPPGARPTGEER